MLDGVLENLTAAMLDPYFDAGRAPDRQPRPGVHRPRGPPRAVPRLDALGFQAHFHALGDRAVRARLDAVEAARRANGRSDTRPHIAHIQVVHPDDIPRFRRLGALANAQPLWAVHEDQMDELTLPFSGRIVSALAVPVPVAPAPGAVLVMGSDWCVSTADPFAQMELAVNRVIPGHEATAARFLPDEADRADRRAAGVHRRVGLREPPRRGGHARGRPAWPISPCSTATCSIAGAGGIGDTRVVATFVDGVAVHEAPELDG